MPEGLDEAREMAAALDVMARVNQADDLDAFVSALLDALADRIRCDLATYSEIDAGGTHFVSVARPPDFPYPTDVYDRFAAHRRQHPVLEHHARTGEGAALRISDFLDRDEYHSTDLYREILGPMKLEHQVVFRLPSPPSLAVVVALSRQAPDFSDADCRVLELLRPHIGATFSHLRRSDLLSRQLELMSGSGGGAARGVVRRGEQGGLVADDEQGERLLARWLAPGATLAKALEDWLAAPADLETPFDQPSGPATVRITAATGTLLIRPETGDDGERRFVLEEQVVDAAALRSLGLTARETEVLARVVEGGTNASIAAALGIRPATVKKLLEHVYAKLGVHNRRAAIAAAVEVLPPQQPGAER